MILVSADWGSPRPFLLFVFGTFLCGMGAVGAYRGKMSARFRWVYLDREPKSFWFLVAVYFLGGLGLIGLYFYSAGVR